VAVRPAIATVNVSPAVTAFAVTDPDAKNVPAELASHTLKWVYVSDVLTFVQVRAVSFAIVPPDEEPNDRA
jgi:hypothetical protein